MKKTGKGSIKLRGYDYSKSGGYFITLVTNKRRHLFGEIKDGKMILNDAGKMIKKWYCELEKKFENVKCGTFIIMPNHLHAIIKICDHESSVRPMCLTDNESSQTNFIKNEENKSEHGDSGFKGKNSSMDGVDFGGERDIYSIEQEDNDIKRPDYSVKQAGFTQQKALNVNPQDLGLEKNDLCVEHSDLCVEHIGSTLHKGNSKGGCIKAASLPRIIQWFKTKTTNEYIRSVKSGEFNLFYKKLWYRNYYEHIIRNKNELDRIEEYILNNPANWEKDKENDFDEMFFNEIDISKTHNLSTKNYIGNINLLQRRKIALFSSVKCPGKIILETYDLMQKLKFGDKAVISGFHSPMEKECLYILLRGRAPVILVPARSLKKYRVLKEFKKAVETERMLIVSPFTDSIIRDTKESAEKRNRFIAEIADEILFAYAAPGSKTEELAKEAVKMHKPIYTFDTKYNENLRGMGIGI